MKALRTLFAAVALLAGVMTMNAQRMSVVAMQSNARFLTDRMAYTLGIRDPFLIDEIYRINYDYIWGVNDYLDDVALGYYYDDYLAVCEARDIALRNLLGYTVWNRLIGYTYFHRPIIFANRGWHFGIYDYDRYGPRHYFYGAPRPIARGYAGGHFFRGMAPVPHGGMAPPPRGGMAPAPRGGMAPAPRGGAPAPGMVPRGGAPAPGMNRSVPPVNHNGNLRSNPGAQPQQGQPRSGNGGVQPQNQRTNPGGNAGTAPSQGLRSNPGGGMGGNTRSGNNVNSSSRGGMAPTRSSAAPTRSNAAPTRGGGSRTGGMMSGGRR